MMDASTPDTTAKPRSDAARWDTRYNEEQLESFERPRPFLIEHAGLLPNQGLALDIAMGLGGNAGFLQERGLKVVGVDISIVALRKAKGRLPEVMAVQADLNDFWIPSRHFDVILNFYYLLRDLWPQYRQALLPGGLLLIETLTQEILQVNPQIDPAFLLQPGELRVAFSDLEVLTYREGWIDTDSRHPKAVASLVARLPTY